jgi:hypothetical protein
MWSTGYELQAVEIRLRQQRQRVSHALDDNHSHIAGKMNRSHDECQHHGGVCLEEFNMAEKAIVRVVGRQ